MNGLKLSKRLSAAASFVRDGAVCADIGTDHAYLPIYLVGSGIASFAVASDINEGPIASANDNIKKYGLENKISTQIADGLDGISQYKPDHILICGMGGELIARIIEDSSYVKKNGIKLILQPMTSIKELREYLAHGFSVYDEAIVWDSGKYYQIICAEYDGNDHIYTDLELEVGKINIRNKTPLFTEYVNHLLKKKRRVYDGLKAGGRDLSYAEKEIKELEALL